MSLTSLSVFPSGNQGVCLIVAAKSLHGAGVAGHRWFGGQLSAASMRAGASYAAGACCPWSANQRSISLPLSVGN